MKIGNFSIKDIAIIAVVAVIVCVAVQKWGSKIGI